MIGLDRALRHLAWSDAWMFDRLAELPAEAMLARYAPEAWPVAQLAIHIVGGAEWYRYCLTGAMWTDLTPPSFEAVALQEYTVSLKSHQAEIDAVLLEQATLAEEEMAFTDEDGPKTALRSTILTEAVLHGIEHRAQIGAALAAGGFDGFALDDVDLWAFEKHHR
jgi:uncharacterized damage-inducible protein DinB